MFPFFVRIEKLANVCSLIFFKHGKWFEIMKRSRILSGFSKVWLCVCVCACVCMRACAYMCVRACVHMCVCACVRAFVYT